MDANNLRRRVYQRLLSLKRGAKRYAALLPRLRHTQQQKVLFILGCQRSGTTLLARIFEHDWRVRLYNEFDDLSSDDRETGIRLNALAKVQETLSKQRFDRIVAKPIVESQRFRELLEFFADSRVIWLYRHFADVAASDLNKFGLRNGIDNLRPIVDGNSANWRAEAVSEPVQRTISAHFSEDMNPHDAAALFWYCRNMSLFSAESYSERPDPRVMLLPYELLVAAPKATVEAIYSFVGWRFPGARIVAEVDCHSVGKPRRIQLSPEIENLCRSLLERLDTLAHYQRPDM